MADQGSYDGDGGDGDDGAGRAEAPPPKTVHRIDDEPSVREAVSAPAEAGTPALVQGGSDESVSSEGEGVSDIPRRSNSLFKRRHGSGAKDRRGTTDSLAAVKLAEVVGSAAEQAATVISAELRNDMAGVVTALENHLDFPFLAPDTHPMHGLQDWSIREWAEYIQKNPELSTLLATKLCGEEDTTRHNPKDLAKKVKAALRAGQPLSKWRSVIAYQNAVLNDGHLMDNKDEAFYISPDLLSNAIFRREFPLGVDNRVAQYRWKFAIENSGLSEIRHRESKGVSILLLVFVGGAMLGVVGYLLNYTVGYPDGWMMNATLQDTENPDYTANVAFRTKNRGVVASIATSLTFSALVNSSLDKFGKIDPATSTVLIGMTLGGTFGYILDNMLGTDEGLREYLWRPQDGMKFALGRLASDRFGRYIVTILFDMFFTVILFRHSYSTLVQLAGFSKNGREWLANAIVSGFIGVITFQVYANMTRFSWAYPSGVDVDGSWISGPTMLLAVVIMNMVYLQSETRVRIHEPGINDPPVKLAMTIVTFVILWQLQQNDMLEPDGAPSSSGVTPDWRDVSLPLAGVCEAQSKFIAGTLIFTAITVVCLGGVIFGTSQQTFSGVLIELGCTKPPPIVPVPAAAAASCARAEASPAGGECSTILESEAPSSASLPRPKSSIHSVALGLSPAKRPSSATPSPSTASSPAGTQMRSSGASGRWAGAAKDINRMQSLKRQHTHNTVVMASNDKNEHKHDRLDHMKGKVCLFFVYLLIVFILMLFFGFTPFARHDNCSGCTRDTARWQAACHADPPDTSVLDTLGLS